MRPIYERPGEGSSVLIKTQQPPQSARTDGGKSLVPFWRRWWRSI